ncbi:MAG TPA: DUF3857 and transglutaminase domain-containing protein [Acidobacteriaceae bacterium]|nr:DUF3857 and transglutaminase domain-containing protein [Acidobacteriaceae bacterium]
MYATLRRVLVLLLVLAPLSTFASSNGGWQQPTPEELTMKSYPADPNAPAVYLYREETVDDTLHMHSLYARVKILTEKGKEMFSDIEIPYEASDFGIDSVAGRTIHSDGMVIPFTGKPYDKLLIKEGGLKIMAKVFSMPDVQVGSIIEYRYELRYGDNTLVSPHWMIQQNIPVVKAHYSFVPSSAVNGGAEITSTLYGHELVANELLFTPNLPPGAKVQTEANGTYELDVENIPALPHDDYMPPINSNSYRLIFYYSPFHTGQEYWKTVGKYWSEDFDRFAKPTDKIREAVNGIVSPGDSDAVKIQKIYDAVMKLDNTSFTREHTAAENQAEGVRIKSAEDIWADKRGTDDEITRLFVAMVRSAGIKAYGAIVVNRDNAIFQPGYLIWSQMDDELAIVEIGGKEVYFDPGQRYCEFGELHWKHTWAGGLRETDDGTQIFQTPGQNYLDNSTRRYAELTLSPNGQIQGVIEVSMKGSPALYWRQAALSTDTATLNKAFGDSLQRAMPPGVVVKTNHFIGLTDPDHTLMVIVNVSGTMGTQTGKHVFLPAVFFEAGDPPKFAEMQRTEPVDMNYPYNVQDQFQVTLPPNIVIDSLPQGGDVPFMPNADYIVKFVSKGNVFAYGRLLRVADPFYKAVDYPALRTFFQKVSADDQQQVALNEVQVPAPAAAPSGAAAKTASGR